MDKVRHQKVITVEGHFGPKELTRKEFVGAWTAHMKDLYRITFEDAWIDKVDAWICEVEKEAGREWDRLYQEQTNKVSS